MSLTAWQLTMLASIPKLLLCCRQHWGHGREVAVAIRLCEIWYTAAVPRFARLGRAGSQVL